MEFSLEGEELWNYEGPASLKRDDWKWFGKAINKDHPPVVLEQPGYNFEYGLTLEERKQNNQEEEDEFLEDVTRYIHYYEKFFHGADHSNFITLDNDQYPVCITLENSKVKDQKQAKCLLHTKEKTRAMMVKGSSAKERIKFLTSSIDKLKDLKFYKVIDEEINNYLLNAERRLLPKSYKFGILYVKEGQNHEDQYFSNCLEEGDALDEFLTMLGKRIELQNWEGYRGGLDTKNNATGTHSVYTEYVGYPIMFHVSGLLPLSSADPQQIERKRHLGNDIVVLVFKEGDSPFDPLTITSHYNHAFLVVQLHQRNPTQYRLALICKDGVLPCRPAIRAPGIVDSGEELREWIIKKLINTERCAMYAPDFSHKDSRTRKTLLHDLGSQFGKSVEKKLSLPKLGKKN